MRTLETCRKNHHHWLETSSVAAWIALISEFSISVPSFHLCLVSIGFEHKFSFATSVRFSNASRANVNWESSGLIIIVLAAIFVVVVVNATTNQCFFFFIFSFIIEHLCAIIIFVFKRFWQYVNQSFKVISKWMKMKNRSVYKWCAM